MSRMTIVAFGDSLTAGSALKAGQKNWTDLLAERLQAQVLNRGVGGNTSGEGLARMEADVIYHRPDVVLICFGMNDHVIVDADGHTKTTESEFAENLTEMAARVRKIGAKPVFVTPNAVMEGLIVIREVAFVKQNATFVIETQVCNLKCTICKRNASL